MHVSYPFWFLSLIHFCISIDARAKLSMQSAVAKARGHQTQTRYPQPEGTLGEAMTKGEQELGEESILGKEYGFKREILIVFY